MSLKSQALSGVKWTTIAKISLALVGLLRISILTRYLDSDAFGLMAIVLFILGFVGLFMDMGLSSAILHKQNIDKDTYGSLYWLNFGFSIVVYLIIYFLAYYIALFYENQELDKLIKLTAGGLIMSAFGRQFKTIFQKKLAFKLISIVDIGSSIFSLIIAVILSIQGFGVYALVYSVLVQYVISNSFFFYYGRKLYGLKVHFSFNETLPFLKIGIYEVGGNVINYFGRDFDILIIGKTLGTDVLGLYSLAKQLVFRPINILNPIITQVATPFFSKIQNDRKALTNNFLKLLKIITTLNFPLYLGIIILAHPIVNIIYGHEYIEIVNLVRILSVYMLFRVIGNPVGSVLLALGRTDVNFKWNLITFFILPLSVYLGSLISIDAVGFSLVLYMIIMFIPSWWILIYRVIGVSLKDYLKAIVPSPYIILNELKNSIKAK